jgi:hypothetical protein
VALDQEVVTQRVFYTFLPFTFLCSAIYTVMSDDVAMELRVVLEYINEPTFSVQALAVVRVTRSYFYSDVSDW